MGKVTLIVLFIVSLLVLFASMILSAMAAHQANIGNTKLSEKYASIAAIMNGTTWGLIVLTFILYLWREKICSVMCKAGYIVQDAFDSKFGNLP